MSLGEMGTQQVADMKKALLSFMTRKPVMAKAVAMLVSAEVRLHGARHRANRQARVDVGRGDSVQAREQAEPAPRAR